MPRQRVLRTADVGSARITSVDLVAPSRVVRGRLPAIEAIQDRLSRQLRVDLFQYMRYGVQIHSAQTQFEPHDEVMRQLKAPVMVGILSLAPLRGFSIVTVDGPLVGAAVDRLCGSDSPTDSGPRDDFSPFESRIAQRLLDVIQDSLRYAWQSVVDLTVERVRTEVNTSFIAIADAQEQLITMRMQVGMATGSGEIVVAIPYPSIEPIRDKLTTAGALTEIRDEDKRYWRIQMKEALERVPVTIRAEMARTSMTGTEIAALQPGQVIPIHIPECAEVWCGTSRLFKADFGAFGDMLAVRARQFHDAGDVQAASDPKAGATEQ